MASDPADRRRSGRRRVRRATVGLAVAALAGTAAIAAHLPTPPPHSDSPAAPLPDDVWQPTSTAVGPGDPSGLAAGSSSS